MQKFRNVPFFAKLAIDDENAHDLVRQPNSDGFKFDSSPLFQVILHVDNSYNLITHVLQLSFN